MPQYYSHKTATIRPLLSQTSIPIIKMVVKLREQHLLVTNEELTWHKKKNKISICFICFILNSLHVELKSDKKWGILLVNCEMQCFIPVNRRTVRKTDDLKHRKWLMFKQRAPLPPCSPTTKTSLATEAVRRPSAQMWRVLTADLAQEQVLQRSCCSAGVAAQLVFASLRGCGLKGDASDSCRCCCASRTRVRLQLRLLNRGTRHAPAFTNCAVWADD